MRYAEYLVPARALPPLHGKAILKTHEASPHFRSSEIFHDPSFSHIHPNRQVEASLDATGAECVTSSASTHPYHIGEHLMPKSHDSSHRVWVLTVAFFSLTLAGFMASVHGQSLPLMQGELSVSLKNYTGNPPTQHLDKATTPMAACA
jgi:hypothetical protein